MDEQYTLKLPTDSGDLDFGEDATVPMTTCANCDLRILKRDAIQTKTEDFCSNTCVADYNRF